MTEKSLTIVDIGTPLDFSCEATSLKSMLSVKSIGT